MIYIVFGLLSALFSAGISYFCVETGLTVFLRGSVALAIVVFIIALIILLLGVLALLYKKGKLPTLSGVLAAQIYTISLAGILLGITLCGVWGGTILGEFKVWAILFGKFNPEIIALISSVFLIICSVIASILCRTDGKTKGFDSSRGRRDGLEDKYTGLAGGVGKFGS